MTTHHDYKEVQRDHCDIHVVVLIDWVSWVYCTKKKQRVVTKHFDMSERN